MSQMHHRDRFVLSFLIFACALLSLPLPSSAALEDAAGARYYEGQLIVQLVPDKSASALADDFASIGLKPVKLLSRRMNAWLFEFDATGLKAAGHDQVLYDVRMHPAVELGQFNHYITRRATLPDDPGFNNQWGLHNLGQTGGVVDADIDAPEAWDLTTSGSTAEGDQIVVAIVDGGCDLGHSDIDFFKNTHEIPGNGVDDDGNGYIDDYDGWDAYSSDGTIPGDDHGTHVAGIAAAIGNNSNGVAGVNWNVKVMPIAGSTTQEAVAVEAYGYALEMRALYNETDGALGAFVVSTNSSFGVDYGNPANFPIWCAMYDSLGVAGILSAAATANIGMDIDQNGDVPTACPSDYLISVTNTTSSDVKNSGAAWGATTIDLGAPGTSVYSTLQGGGYGYKTGTSMATPHVAGAVGFLYSAALPGVINLARLRPDSVALLFKQAILDGTDINSSLDGITVSGGRLNLFTAAQLVQNIPTGVTITHTPLADTRDTLNAYEVSAIINSDTSLIADSLLLYWETGGIWTTITLAAGTGDDEYVGNIPAQGPGTDVSYYLYAFDEEGKADTTETFTFRVIDYGVAAEPPAATDNGAVNDTIWYEARVTNIGVLADQYTLNVVSSKWSTALYDETMTSVITSTPVLVGDEYFDVAIRVIVPVSVYGNADTATVDVVSTGDPSYHATVTLVTVSDGEPAQIPFSESFTSTEFDNSLWVIIINATINDIALDEPSAPYSLNLDGEPSGADTLMSQAINLKDETNVIVRYSYQRTGGGDSPESGDDLFVEFKDSTDSWQLLGQYDGGGPDMTTFVQVPHSLPGEAMHSAFRLRFRSSGTAGTFDDWFVDDVYVGPPPAYDVDLTPSFATQYGSAGDTAVFLMTVFNRGANADQYVLTASNNVWPVQFFDAEGANPITTTPSIAPGDSGQFTAKTAIPEASLMNESDSALIRAISVHEGSVWDMSVIRTISAGPPGGFPWYEIFPEDTLFTDRWVVNVGAVVTDASLNPPSAPYALDLDGGIDTVVSQVIDLSGQAQALFSYYFEAGTSESPDAGDDLWVEYKNNVGGWVLLQQHAGGGPITGQFTQVVFPLPGDALHSDFQFRFRSYGSCDDCDHWYLDDIRVDYAPDIDIDPVSFEFTLSQGDSATGELVITNAGLGGLDYYLRMIPTTKNSALARLVAEESLEPARRLYAEGFDEYEDPKGVPDSRPGHPVTRDAGGPDTYGYFWIDSDEPGGPEFDWIDVSASGTDVVGDLGDDSFGGPYEIGFDFPFYDSIYSELFIGSNGIVGFAPDNMGTRFKKSIPTETAPNAVLAWLWDDLNPTDGDNPNAAVYIDAGPDRCVIQFADYPEYQASAGDVVNAEIILYPDGSITYQYLSVAPGFDVLSCAVGIENPTGTDGLETAYLTAYLKDSLAIKYTNPYQWLSFSHSSGTVLPDSVDTVFLSFRSSELDTGQHQISLVVNSNDPDESSLAVPATLIVEIPWICGDVDGGGDGPNVQDLTYLVSYLFKGGPPPPVMEASDADGSGGGPNVTDLTYLVAFLFKGGPPPVCSG